MANVSSDEALGILRRVAIGEAVPRLKNPRQQWDEETVELVVDGWHVSLFADVTRSRHVNRVTSPDGRLGSSEDWRSDEEFSQQPEDRLYREDSDAVDRMFQAFRRAR
ncbi:MAG: hypothetical protein ABSG31_00810 [Tepidisphaeraceae bacterium]|jgi:hypothetical protein